jgi:cysteine sulfinate desulfinase/cysteine desulfurase-like protein
VEESESLGKMASLIGTNPKEIIFISGTNEVHFYQHKKKSDKKGLMRLSVSPWRETNRLVYLFEL